MFDRFGKISNGEYAGKLYELFGQDRVDAELESYLGLGEEFFPRFGGGIGLKRLYKGLEVAGLFGNKEMAVV